jgi:predicted CXXCH cytochrome family protein
MGRLKRILGTTAAIVALVGLPVAASAGIGGSEHDFSGQGWSGGEICVVCHTPHNGDITLEAPLWDHDVTAVTDYTVYTSATLTAESGAIGQPGSVSLLCLSCHDGTVAVDSFGGATGTVFLTSTDAGYLGEDLSDDHPVGLTYDTALSVSDPGLYDPTTTDALITEKPGNIDVAMLFGASNDQVECASCHDPHRAATLDPFLRKTMAASALCLTCHNK